MELRAASFAQSHDGENHTPGGQGLQPDSRPKPKRSPNHGGYLRPDPVRLLSLSEIIRAWEVSYVRVYSRLTPFRRPGQKPYYSEAEARERLGEPLHSIEVRAGNGAPKPPYLSRQEIGQALRDLRIRRRLGTAVARKVRPSRRPGAPPNSELRSKVAS